MAGDSMSYLKSGPLNISQCARALVKDGKADARQFNTVYQKLTRDDPDQSHFDWKTVENVMAGQGVPEDVFKKIKACLVEVRDDVEGVSIKRFALLI